MFTALGCGLIAGVFYIFSTTVMRAFGRLPEADGIAAMNAINAVIINPWFLGAFLGTGLLSAVLVILSAFRLGEAGSAYLLAGALTYLIGTLLITVVFNVPLNNALAASPSDGEFWKRYLSDWTLWNHVRTIAALAAATLLTLGLAILGAWGPTSPDKPSRFSSQKQRSPSAQCR